MYRTGAVFFSGKARYAKRFVALAFVVALTLVAFDRLGWRLSSFAASDDDPPVGGETRKTTTDDCGYLKDPDGIRNALAKHREMVSNATVMVSEASNSGDSAEVALVPPQNIPRKNFIDNILFDKMAKDAIESAPLSTDEEFVRRVYLDVTGRIPSADDVTAFLADKSTTKRDALVDKLVGSPEYVDKWTMFFGDLFKNNARSVNVQRYSGGRDAFYNYIKKSIADNKNYKQIATDLITAMGDNFVNGEANFIIGGIVPMGPAQDTMDGTAVNAASMFLGIGALDCLLCHGGAGHLDSVNLWGAQRSREEAWGMSAFFARVRRQRQALSQQPNYAKYQVSENANGEYLLNTDFGNRQTRAPIDGKNTIAPRYILGGGGINAGENRRQALARMLTADKQFARAAVNYIWEKLMVEALVSPSNAFDPARLDPKATLPEGWTLQPANAELLEALAEDFIKSNYNLRTLIATITKSSAYQLSSQYPGEWSLAKVPYYARKLARRMDAEEVHDAIVKASGIMVTYQLRDTLNQPTFTINWAMQSPDTTEPRPVPGAQQNGLAQQFMGVFVRGDRDVRPRSNEPTIQQTLNLMNHPFVMSRIHNANAGSNVNKLLSNQALTAAQITTQLYLATLSRNPSPSELETLTPLFTSMGRTQAAEAVQWALLNKMDFVFNY